MMDFLLAGWNRVDWPCPGRRLRGVVSVAVPGRMFCRHLYRQCGFHTEAVGRGETILVKEYTCVKCGRTVHVLGSVDDAYMEKERIQG